VSGHQGSRRKRLTYANVTSTIALMIAVSGGTAFAATHLITGKQIAKGTITATNIKSRSLLATSFKKGQIPAGAKGATGATGSTGSTGAAGAAGTAIAYGTMLINGSGNPAFNAGAVGFTTVTEPQANIYCVAIPAGATGIQPIISDFGGNNDAVFSFASPQQCPGEYEVAQESGTAVGNGQGFVIMIP
jgi:hypothetical protein